jgi:hypothetical protein
MVIESEPLGDQPEEPSRQLLHCHRVLGKMLSALPDKQCCLSK